jgi:hypothetical protein
MSFTLAVWEGPRPSADALAEFERLSARYLGTDDPAPPTPRVRAFIEAITAKYPDLGDLSDDEIDDGVWSDGPLVGNANGPFFYFGLVWSRVEEVVPFLAETARAHGLVCFDPQSNALI